MPKGPLDDAVEQVRLAIMRGSPHADKFVPLLFGVAEIVCQLHREDKLYLPAADEGNPGRCPHDPESDWDEHFEGDDGVWYCTSRPAGSECRCGAEWPCGEYTDVLAALTGQWASRDTIRESLTAAAPDATTAGEGN